MQASNRRTLGVVGVLVTAMILLVAPRRQRVGRHRRPGAQVQQPRQRQGRSHPTARHRRSQCTERWRAMRIIIARGVLQFRCRPEVNAMQATLAVSCGTARVSETGGCSQICSKTWCDVPERLRRGETVRLCMPRLDGTSETRCERLDRARAAHNPEVGGSNPPLATENCLMA
jgi:hypothetical protein